MLTAIEIGKLALHIEAALIANPIEPELDEDGDIICEEMPGDWKEPWEEDLKSRVDADPTLPDYDELDMTCGLLDFLVEHLDESIKERLRQADEQMGNTEKPSERTD